MLSDKVQSVSTGQTDARHECGELVPPVCGTLDCKYLPIDSSKLRCVRVRRSFMSVGKSYQSPLESVTACCFVSYYLHINNITTMKRRAKRRTRHERHISNASHGVCVFPTTCSNSRVCSLDSGRRSAALFQTQSGVIIHASGLVWDCTPCCVAWQPRSTQHS